MIVHVTDLHFDRKSYAAVAALVRRHSADLCISGDLLDDSARPPAPRDEQIAWVSAWIRKQNFRIIACSGNHDVPDDEIPNTKWLRALHDGQRVFTDGASVDLDGRRLYCLPYGQPLHEPLVANALAGTDILLTHVGPSGSPVARAVEGDYGDFELEDFLRATSRTRQRLILCGHVHAPATRRATHGRVTIINPGAALGRAKAAIPHTLVEPKTLAAILEA